MFPIRYEIFIGTVQVDNWFVLINECSVIDHLLVPTFALLVAYVLVIIVTQRTGTTPKKVNNYLTKYQVEQMM